MKIAVCVPCAPKDRGYLKYCLLSIQAQTRPADIVVVSLSNILDPAKLVLDTSGVTIPVEYVYSPKTLFAGANRNLASARAVELGADILSYIDADDFAHPQRLECIEKLFTEKEGLTGLLHHFISAPKQNLDIYTGVLETPWEPITNDYLANGYQLGSYNRLDIIKFQTCFTKKIRRGYGQSACGHITVLAEFWKETPYLETIGRGEDNHFCSQILKQKRILGYTCDTLSTYMRTDRKGFLVGM